MSVVHVAHRVANDLERLQATGHVDADLLEGDVHLRRGRLEVRHAKSLGPLPWLWEPWYLLPREPLLLADVARAAPSEACLLLDLKGWQPWLGRRVRRAMQDAPRYVVCSRHWRMLDAFDAVADVRVVHSVRTRSELARLDGRLAAHPTWGISVHQSLLTAARVEHLRSLADVVMTWPVDTPTDYDRLAALGVNGFISNNLDVLSRRRPSVTPQPGGAAADPPSGPRSGGR